MVDEPDPPGVLERQTHQALSCLKWLDILVVLHCLSVVLSPPYAALLSAGWFQPAWVFGAMFVWSVASLYVLTVYLVFRAAIIVRVNALPMIVCTLLALCPCINLLAIFMASEATRRFLFQQGVPFRGYRPDWNALRTMAETMPTEQGRSQPEDVS